VRTKFPLQVKHEEPNVLIQVAQFGWHGSQTLFCKAPIPAGHPVVHTLVRLFLNLLEPVWLQVMQFTSPGPLHVSQAGSHSLQTEPLSPYLPSGHVKSQELVSLFRYLYKTGVSSLHEVHSF
jgi:hypothetical protein